MAQHDFRATADKDHLISQVFYMIEQGDRRGLETAHQKLMATCFGQTGVAQATADAINKICRNPVFQDPECHSAITLADQFLTAFLEKRAEKGLEIPVVNACLKSTKIQEATNGSWDIEFATYAVRINPYHTGALTAHERIARDKFRDSLATEVLVEESIRALPKGGSSVASSALNAPQPVSL